MSTTKKAKIALTEKMSKKKPIQIRINTPRHSLVRLEEMPEADLKREIDGLPQRINAATLERDVLMGKLRQRWSTAYANDQQFITAYARAEAAGNEVVYLLDRAVKASRIYAERTSGKLF